MLVSSRPIPIQYENKNSIYSEKLKDAVISNDLDDVKFYLALGADVNQEVWPSRQALLHLADSCSITEELLKYGADVNAKDRYSRTPLFAAIGFNKRLSVMRKLLSYGADPNVRDRTNETPLLFATRSGKALEVIRELLRNHADINAFDNCGETALHLAVRLGKGINLDIVKELVEFGADIFHSRVARMFHEALDRNYRDCIELILKILVLNESRSKKLFDWFTVALSPSLMKFTEKCFQEVSLMESHKVSPNHSLHYFAVKKGDTIKVFYQSYKIVAEDIIKKYPIYSDIILTNVKLCSERAVLLEKLKGLRICSCPNKGGKIVTLNSDCVFRIAEYLPNSHLFDFVKAFR